MSPKGTSAEPVATTTAGFAALTPGWPDDPDTVEEGKAHPEGFAKKSVGQVAELDHTVPWAISNASCVSCGDGIGGICGSYSVHPAMDP
jgi:hypothetical protein